MNSKKNDNILNTIYFKSLTIENLNCFKEKHEFNFSDGNNKHAQWTVILGNNNTGKTTILKTLADSVPFEIDKERFVPSIIKNRSSYTNSYHINFDLFKDNEAYKLNYAKISEKIQYNFIVYGYGIKRKASKKTLSDTNEKDTTLSLFDENVELTNIEEWLLQLDYAIKNKSKIAKERLIKVKEILTSEVLPDITDFEFITNKKLDSYVLFEYPLKKVWNNVFLINFKKC